MSQGTVLGADDKETTGIGPSRGPVQTCEGLSKRMSLKELRHDLHRTAEPSGDEERTARVLVDALEPTGPDALETGWGGHGVAAVYSGEDTGPTVLLRADMDALPLDDDPSLPYASRTQGVAHRCGHDGHMAMLVGVGRRLAEARPKRGRVVLMFQPAEETGAGAAGVLEDPRFGDLEPDRVFALHNLPGFPLGSVVVRAGGFASSSRGMIVEYQGRESHAAEPQLGTSPVPALTALADILSSLPQQATALHEGAKVTVVGLQAGGAAFGVSPGSGRLMATLRAHAQETMELVARRAAGAAAGLAALHGLRHTITWEEDFPAAENHPGLTGLVEDAARALELDTITRDHPFPWSEDFARFLSRSPGVLFGLGSGPDQPPLHTEGYDFPDELLDTGSGLLFAIAERALEDDAG